MADVLTTLGPARVGVGLMAVAFVVWYAAVRAAGRPCAGGARRWAVLVAVPGAVFAVATAVLGQGAAGVTLCLSVAVFAQTFVKGLAQVQAADGAAGEAGAGRLLLPGVVVVLLAGQVGELAAWHVGLIAAAGGAAAWAVLATPAGGAGRGRSAFVSVALSLAGAAAAGWVMRLTGEQSGDVAAPLVASAVVAAMLMLPVLGLASGPARPHVPGAADTLAVLYLAAALPAGLVAWQAAAWAGLAEGPAVPARAYRLDALLLLVVAVYDAARLGGSAAGSAAVRWEGVGRLLLFAAYLVTLLLRVRV